VFLSEGLKSIGETELADQVRRAFSEACLKGG